MFEIYNVISGAVVLGGLTRREAEWIRLTQPDLVNLKIRPASH